MAKMTDKKPGKAKPKAKAARQGQEVRRRERPRPPWSSPPAVRQPGVERRRNHPTRSKDGHMQVLLTHAVPHFGQPGDLVKVRPGFARNYLLPQGLATFATPHNLRIVEKHRERLRQLEAGPPGRPAEPRRPDRPAVDHHRGQRQRRRAPLRLGQRRPDRRRPEGRQLPDRDRQRQDRRPAQGAGPLHHQALPRPGRRHRGQALGRPDPR